MCAQVRVCRHVHVCVCCSERSFLGLDFLRLALVLSLIAQLVKNPPAKQETLIGSLGREDPPGEETGYPLQYSWASLVAQLVKNLPAMWETWVRSLGWEDPRRRETLPTAVFWPGESMDCVVPGVAELDTTERLSLSFTSLVLARVSSAQRADSVPCPERARLGPSAVVSWALPENSVQKVEVPRPSDTLQCGDGSWSDSALLFTGHWVTTDTQSPAGSEGKFAGTAGSFWSFVAPDLVPSLSETQLTLHFTCVFSCTK